MKFEILYTQLLSLKEKEEEINFTVIVSNDNKVISFLSYYSSQYHDNFIKTKSINLHEDKCNKK